MLRGLGTALAPLCEPLGGLVPGEWLQECKAAGDTLGTWLPLGARSQPRALHRL